MRRFLLYIHFISLISCNKIIVFPNLQVDMIRLFTRCVGKANIKVASSDSLHQVYTAHKQTADVFWTHPLLPSPVTPRSSQSHGPGRLRQHQECCWSLSIHSSPLTDLSSYITIYHITSWRSVCQKIGSILQHSIHRLGLGCVCYINICVIQIYKCDKYII